MKTSSLLVFVTSLISLVAALASTFFPSISYEWPFRFFYLSMCLISLCLLMEYKNITSLLSKKWYYLGSDTIIRITTLILIFSLGQFLIEKRGPRWDFTEDRIYSVSEDTIKLLKSTPLKISVYASPAEHTLFHISLTRFIDGLKNHVPNLEVDFIDVVRLPSRAKDKGVDHLPGMMLTHKEESVYLRESQLIQNRPATESLFLGEGALQAAISRLLNQITVNVLAPGLPHALLDDSPTGFGGLASLIRQNGFQINFSDEEESIKAGDSPLLILLPNTARFGEKLGDIYRKYPNPSLLLIEAGQSINHPEFTISRDVVLDPPRALREEADLIAPLADPGHQISYGLGGQMIALYGAAAIHPSKDSSMLPILHASSVSWLGKSQLPIKPDRNSLGPHILMGELPGPRLILGDTDWANNQGLTLPGNRDLLLNSIHYLSGQNHLIFSRSKAIRARMLQVSREGRYQFLVLLLFVLPGLALATALSLYLWQEKTA